jgi:hypothetical protein
MRSLTRFFFATLRFPIRVELDDILPGIGVYRAFIHLLTSFVSCDSCAVEIQYVSLFPHQFQSSMHAALLL